MRRTVTAAPEDTDSDRLYGLPLPEFTRARNRLARELSGAGRAEAAAAVRRLAKPTPVVWAVNQLARRDRVGVERLVQAVEHLRAAQLEGTGLGAAAKAEREALEQSRAGARALLTAAGFAGSAEMLERVTATLLGAATDPAARADLRRGRLTAERDRPGFDVLATGAATPTRRRVAGRPSRPPAAAPDRRLGPAREALEAARAEAAETSRRAEELARLAARQRDAAEAARRAAAKARREAAAAAKRSAGAQATLRSLGTRGTPARGGAPGHSHPDTP